MLSLKSSDRIARIAILALLFMSGVLAANQGVLGSWLIDASLTLAPIVNVRVTLGPVPLYVGVRGFEGAFKSGGLIGGAVVEVISANKTNRLDSIFMTDTYTAGTVQLAPGTEIYLHVHCTDPRWDFYDEWYHAIVGQNQPVMRLRPGLGTRDAPAPLGGLSGEYYGRMTRYITGSAEYWQITPTFYLMKRNEINDLGNWWTFKLLNPGGVEIRNATAVSSASGAPDSAAADFSLSGTFSLKLSVDLGISWWAYGDPMLFLGPPPDYGWRIGYLVIWVSFNTTSIRASYLTANGWILVNQFPSLTPGYLTFYKVLPPVSGNGIITGSATYDIPVDTGSLPSGTGISVRVWIADLQVPADASRGVSDGVPPPYGGVGGYGISTTIFANGFLISSNKPTGQLIWAAFKTA